MESHNTGGNGSAQLRRRFGAIFPIILFVLFFVACCGVIVCVFIRASSISSYAEQYSTAVQICRNEAERLRASSEISDVPDRILYFDGSCSETAEESAAYTLRITETLEECGAGLLRRDHLSLSAGIQDTAAAETLYSLDVEVYMPDGGTEP